jgi:hypothetical protein
MRLFFNPAVVTRLQDVRYAFTDPTLRSMAETFHRALLATPDKIRSKGLREYTPLREMASSIQF